jgi:hypothetical protein
MDLGSIHVADFSKQLKVGDTLGLSGDIFSVHIR